MGRGDKKSKKGKIWRNSYGKKRNKQNKNTKRQLPKENIES